MFTMNIRIRASIKFGLEQLAQFLDIEKYLFVKRDLLPNQ